MAWLETQRHGGVGVKAMPHGVNAAESMLTERETRRFILDNLLLGSVPFVPEISLYLAHPASGLRRLTDKSPSRHGEAPYWAFAWGGGLALARHILDHPDLVRGKSVLDIGSGSGLVAIAAKLAGAADVAAMEIDPHGCAAIRLNAQANGVSLTVALSDPLEHAPPFTDLVTAGDVFYDAHLAQRMLPFLAACLAGGCSVLIGDPRRANLPQERLRLIAEYSVGDVGGARDARVKAGVFTLTHFE